jgi:hypothetical protein
MLNLTKHGVTVVILEVPTDSLMLNLTKHGVTVVILKVPTDT